MARILATIVLGALFVTLASCDAPEPAQADSSGAAGVGSATRESESAGGAPEELAGEIAETMAETMAETLAEGFAEAFAGAQREYEEAERVRRAEIHETLRAVTRAEFDAAWKLGRDLRGEPALAAVERLGAELGLAVDFGAERGKFALAITRDVRGLSRVQAIEAIAADLGCHPVFPAIHDLEGLGGAVARSMGGAGGALATRAEGGAPARSTAGAIRFEAGPCPIPVTHAGPFRIAAESVTQEPRYATGSVEVVARAYGLFPALMGAHAALDEVVTFEAVLDERGRELRQDPDVHYLGGGRMARGASEDRTSIDLRGLLRSVPRIGKIAGTQRLVLPTAVSAIELSPLATGASGKFGKLRYTVREVGPTTTIVFTGPSAELKALSVLGRPHDAAGQDLAVEYENTSSWGSGETQYQLQCAAAPARLDVKCITDREILEYPFALEAIALPRANEAPAELPPLAFPGHGAPLEVQFVGIRTSDDGFPQVLLSLSNHSNKDAGSVAVRFEYLDAAGKRLEDFPHTLSAPASFEGPKALVPAGRTAPHEATAFFLPEGTASVRVVVESAEFMDASVWVPGRR